LKQLIESDKAEGLESLLGESVLLMCMNYFYAGKLIGVNEADVILEDARIVYDTGTWSNDSYSDAQKIGPKEWLIRVYSIESYGKVEK